MDRLAFSSILTLAALIPYSIQAVFTCEAWFAFTPAMVETTMLFIILVP